MEKFVIKGKGSNSDYTFGVAIAKAKHFHIQAVFKGEKKLQVQHVINDAEQIVQGHVRFAYLQAKIAILAGSMRNP